MKHRSDLASKIEVSVDEAQWGSLTLARLVTMYRSFERSRPPAATSELRTNDRRDDDLPIASVCLGQQCPEHLWRPLPAQPVEARRVEH
jgi:hypothetical protein